MNSRDKVSMGMSQKKKRKEKRSSNEQWGKGWTYGKEMYKNLTVETSKESFK